MKTAVDANVFFDLLSGTTEEAKIAYAALAAAKAVGNLIVSTVCYAEVSRNFGSQEKTTEFFDLMGCRIDNVDPDQAFLAGKFFAQYRQRGGTRSRILTDFLIAAHARLNADRILTRDDRFFGSGFPQLKAVSPKDLI